MNTIQAREGGYLTQITENIPIEERVFVKRLTGVMATSDYYREATDAEVEEWKEYLKRQETFIITE